MKLGLVSAKARRCTVMVTATSEEWQQGKIARARLSWVRGSRGLGPEDGRVSLAGGARAIPGPWRRASIRRRQDQVMAADRTGVRRVTRRTDASREGPPPTSQGEERRSA